MSNEKFDGIITISATPGGSARITLNGRGHSASSSLGEAHPGLVWIGSESAFTSSTTGTGPTLGTTVYHGAIFLNRSDGRQAIGLTAGTAEITVGGAGSEGDLKVRDAEGNDVVLLNGGAGSSVMVLDSNKHRVLHLDDEGSGPVGMYLGVHLSQGTSRPGVVAVRNPAGRDSIVLDGAAGRFAMNTYGGAPQVVIEGGKVGDVAGKISVSSSLGMPTITLDGAKGNIILPTITLDGENGDIVLNNADCAEDFDVSDSRDIDPGTVVVIDEDSKLRPSDRQYDNRVVGVISGAGACKPGLVLDRQRSQLDRLPVALMGKVYCKADATVTPIAVGDLLTTSGLPGHAMKATDPLKVFGTVIGKALRPLTTGCDLIPILVALQ
jgi:hypothetical protein